MAKGVYLEKCHISFVHGERGGKKQVRGLNSLSHKKNKLDNVKRRDNRLIPSGKKWDREEKLRARCRKCQNESPRQRKEGSKRGILTRCDLPSSDVKKGTGNKREAWNAEVSFENQSPPTETAGGLSSTEKGKIKPGPDKTIRCETRWQARPRKG